MTKVASRISVSELPMNFDRIKSPTSFSLCLGLALFVWTQLAHGQDTVETVDGRTATGKLATIDANGAVTGSGMEGLNLEQILSIRFEAGQSVPNVDDGVAITLIDGGSVVVRNPVMDGESIAFEAVAGVDSISMQSVGSLVFREMSGLRDAISGASTENDLVIVESGGGLAKADGCLLYTSPSPRDATLSRMPSSA